MAGPPLNSSVFLLEAFYLPDPDDDDFQAIDQAPVRLSAADEPFSDFDAVIGVDYGPRLDSAERTELRVDIDARAGRARKLTSSDLRGLHR
ncbi:MAG: hypothetical protein OXN97_04560 [Bryobacterales bacterium]|nr:hypothetical protein [Bryobacterales bacterium]MDE0625816.1 hypothetical protein [Bryobacterales bacterium]